MKINELTDEEYFRTNLYEMTNFWSKDTGLPDGTKLWVREEPNALPHVRYRIKLIHPQRGSAVFAIWGDEAEQVSGDWEVTGKTLKKVKFLIQVLTNEEFEIGDEQQTDLIRKFIDSEITNMELGSAMKSVKSKVEEI